MLASCSPASRNFIPTVQSIVFHIGAHIHFVCHTMYINLYSLATWNFKFIAGPKGPCPRSTLQSVHCVPLCSVGYLSHLLAVSISVDALESALLLQQAESKFEIEGCMPRGEAPSSPRLVPNHRDNRRDPSVRLKVVTAANGAR